MKALIKAERGVGLIMADVSMPTFGPNDVLIRVRRASVCGTDLHIWNWDSWAQRTVAVPLTIGHEFMGTVAELGDEVRGFTIGQRVSAEGHITCGTCRNCRAGKRHLCRNTVGIGVARNGAFAEYIVMPAVNVFALPDTISDDVASFLDPLGNAVHTALSFDLVGEDVLITGAGPIGVMAVAIARFVGARHVVVTDVNEYRLDLARRMGATRAVNVATTDLQHVERELGMTEGFDVGLEMSGNGSALRQMLSTMNHGGRVALLGIPPDEVAIDWNLVIFKGLIIKGIYGREMFETWYKMTAMLGSGLGISEVITHHVAADDFADAFEIMRSGHAGKIVMDWAPLE
jgi:threonine 3-dehydrogenase